VTDAGWAGIYLYEEYAAGLSSHLLDSTPNSPRQPLAMSFAPILFVIDSMAFMSSAVSNVCRARSNHFLWWVKALSREWGKTGYLMYLIHVVDHDLCRRPRRHSL